MTIKEEVKKYMEKRRQKVTMTDNQILAEMEYILDDIYALGDKYMMSEDRNIDAFRLEVENKIARYLEFATYLK